ncbi:MAG: hypothetical protein ACREUG_03890 [Steroidobacteraceae bacterium]
MANLSIEQWNRRPATPVETREETECHDPEHAEAMRHLAGIMDTEAEIERLTREKRQAEDALRRTYEPAQNQAREIERLRGDNAILRRVHAAAIGLVDAISACATPDDELGALALGPELEDVQREWLAARECLMDPRGAVETSEQPAGYLHEIIEPDGHAIRMYSQSESSPWSHWLEKHRDQCKYRCAPLYARRGVETNSAPSAAVPLPAPPSREGAEAATVGADHHGGCRDCSTDSDYDEGEYSRHRCPEANAEIVQLRSENERLRRIALHWSCYCGATDPDPADHHQHCDYRKVVEGR